MKRHLYSARDLIVPVIDFFYPPFRKFLNLQTFRYAACGGINTVLGLVVYAVCYKYILREKNLHLGFYAFKPHVGALFISFCFSLLLGFFLSKYVVFDNSSLKGKVQLFRYFLQCLSSLVLNYILLKLLVELMHIYPIAAQIITTVIVVIFSYLAQKYYTFKVSSLKRSVKN